MTAAEVAQIFNGRRTGRGKWIALCPVHGDTKPSMTIKEGKKCVLVGCLSHNCDLRDICKAGGISVKALWYDSESKQDAKAYAEMHRKRREQEAAEREQESELKYWHRETHRWERIAAMLFTHMLGLGRTPQALVAADLWHKALRVARMRRERLWTLQRPSGVPRHKLGEVDCYILPTIASPNHRAVPIYPKEPK